MTALLGGLRDHPHARNSSAESTFFEWQFQRDFARFLNSPRLGGPGSGGNQLMIIDRTARGSSVRCYAAQLRQEAAE